MFSSINLITTEFVALLSSMAYTNLVKESVAINIHLCWPLDSGFISPMKSSPHCLKGSSTCIGITGRGESFCPLAKNWHFWHDLTWE